MHRHRAAAAFCLAIAFLVATKVEATDSEPVLLIAAGTSLENSGLLSHLRPIFRDEAGIELRVLAVGTARALLLARSGDVDAVLVHEPASEAEFVAAGWGRDRREVMYNDFILVGPRDDPAEVRQAADAAKAFARIAARRAPFASRGDDSGTHRAELRVWRSLGTTPEGSWYRSLGSGQGTTLNAAAAMGAYALTDRATWLAFANRRDLELLFAGGPSFANPYSSILVARDRHPHRAHDLAETWHRWLQSPAGRAAILAFRTRGERPFEVRNQR